MKPLLLLVLLSVSKISFALSCYDTLLTTEQRVNSASEIFIAEITSAVITDYEAKPKKVSATYRIAEIISGEPKENGTLTSELSMGGEYFMLGRYYLVLLQGDNYVGYCQGSSALREYRTPYETEESKYLDMVRHLASKKT